MTTKTGSAKVGKRTHRGRPRKQGVMREPNGRISRAKDPAARVALEARARHTGLSLAAAADPRAETYIGRLSMLGRNEGLSRDQYEAALKFLEIRNDYRRSLLSPGAEYATNGCNTHLGEEDMEEYAQWVARAQRRYAAALKAIQEAQFDNGHENLYAALQYVVINGLELPHLLGPARMALNALHRHFIRRMPPRKRRSLHERRNVSLGSMLCPIHNHVSK